MRLDYLLQRYLEEVLRERTNARRVALYLLPLIALPLGGLITQLLRDWTGLFIGALGAIVLLAQLDLFTRPALKRLDLLERDAPLYLELPAVMPAPSWLGHARLLLPGALCLACSIALFAGLLRGLHPDLHLIGAVLTGLLALVAAWQPINTVLRRTAELQQRINAALDTIGAPHEPSLAGGSAVVRARQGMLDPALLEQFEPFERELVSGNTRVSPAGLALLRAEGYLILRDFPETDQATVWQALYDLNERIIAEEQAAMLLPPVGGKIYLPCAARGTLGITLGATMRRLGLDGTFSGVLGTWLVRLPPARSYKVLTRLINSLMALGLLPNGSVLPFHLTIQGALSQNARLLSLLNLAAAPLIMEERTGHASNDDRPFIMQGSWVLDDLGGKRRTIGARTDFVDGFVLVTTPGLSEIEHLLQHGINLRIKQVLAWPLLLLEYPGSERTLVERNALLRFWRLEHELTDLLTRYGLEEGLSLRWLDGSWSELGPFLRRLNQVKLSNRTFLREIQALRDEALNDIEAIAAGL